MNTPLQHSVGQVSGAQVTGRLESEAGSKSSQGVSGFFSRLGQGISQRFQDAADSFRFEYGRIVTLPTVGTQAPRLFPLRVSALLISQSNGEVVPLGEGSNIFALSDAGLRRTDRPANPYEKPDLVLSVIGDRLLKEEKEAPVEKFVTNGRVMLGNRNYVVKIIPDEYRRELKLLAEGIGHA